MYLRGNRWTMNRRPAQRSSVWRIILLLVLIGAGIYINRVVVPATPPLFIPTPTLTQSPEAFVSQAEQMFKEGKLTQSVAKYKEALNADPGQAANYVALARVQVFVGKYEDAIVNTQNALLKNPNNPLAHAVQGWALGFLNKYGEAEREILEAIKLDQNSALTHAYYAEILINQGDYTLFDKAIEESKKARDLDPSLLEVHRARGIVLLNTQNVEQSVEEFQTALAINRNIADLYLNLGIAYKLLEKYDLAQEALLAAYALNPTDTVALTELSRAFFADGRYAQAAQYAEEAAKVNPGDPRLHGNLGIIYYKNNDYAKAIPELALSVKGGTAGDNVTVKGLPLSYGRVEEYYWYFGFALARSDRCGEAIPIFQALLTGVPDDDIAVYNATEGMNICQGGSPTPVPAITPQGTPSRGGVATPRPTTRVKPTATTKP